MIDPLEARASLRSALVADALDAIGRRRQCLGVGIRPLDPGHAISGRAFPVVAVRSDAPREVPYEGLLRAIDAIGQDEVFVYPTGRSDIAAVWGELISAACRAKGVRGTVTDGLTRDASRIRELEYPLFCRGTLPYDVNGRMEVVDHSQVVEIDGVTIQPGDLVVADDDGVVIVPQEVEQEVVERSIAKNTLERQFREAVEDGERASAIFERLSVL